MTARPVTPSQLRAYVDKARQTGHAVVGFRAAPVWDDNGALGEDVVVAACASTLAVRGAVWDHLDADDGRLLVVLADVDDVGQEVLARMYRRELLHPESLEILKDLFRVGDIAAPLRDHQWLADLLVDVAPVGRSFAPPPSGTLDLDTAWRTLLTHGLGLTKDRPSMADLLGWASQPDAAAAMARFSDDAVQRIGERLSARVGGAAPVLLQLIRDGRHTDVVPLGLVADVLYAPGTIEGAVAGKARFEQHLGDPDLSTVDAREWAQAAVELTRQAAQATEQETFTTWTGRATRLLADEVRAPELLWASDVLPSAFEARLSTVGQAILDALPSPSPTGMAAVSTAAEQVRVHVDAERMGHRVRLVDMAERLVRRLHRAESDAAPAVDLAEAAARYVGEGAWVDDARLTLLAGDQVPTLGQAAHRLVAAIAEEQTTTDARFADRLAQWTTVAPTSTSALLPIEAVLDEVVVPIVAAGTPALVLLLDGLSWAQAHRMFGDIANRRFRRVAPGGRWAPVVSMLPSVTQVSRSSFWAGRPVAGGQDVEVEGFAAHAGLREAAKGAAPVLFHKADLYAVDGHPAPDVNEAITDPAQPVVGVVVNGADDHLDKGAQLELADGLRALRPLEQLLQWAVAADRAVVVIADHGHVRETGSTVRPHKGGGERWRIADADPAEDEVLLAGPRVLKGEGRIVAPATESVRYNATKKLGYHGGATPQEVLCPLAVFVPGTVDIDGWLPALPETPAWWSEHEVAVPDLPAPAPVVQPPTDDKGVPTLFGPDTEVPAPAAPADGVPEWISQLVASPLFAQQQQAAGRQTLDADDATAMLTLLADAGGTLTGEAFARALGLASSRARSKATALASLLNIDGYAAITVSGDGEVRLDREVVTWQFALA